MKETINQRGGVILTERDFRKWVSEDWTHSLIIYGVIVITLSLIVQIIATVILGRLL